MLRHALTLAALLAAPACTPDASRSGVPATAAEAPVLVDGQPASLLVIGYSTSYAWPALLQDMLDEHAGERRWTVLNTVVGGSPLGRWIAEPGSDDYEATYGAMRRDFLADDAPLLGNAPRPTIALLQQSLQRTPTPDVRLGPVTSRDDAAGIGVGADALARAVDRLRDDGIERVVIAMHIYKAGFEPEIGNERFALDALVQRGLPGVSAGPDVWSPTAREHPDAFAADGLHPNERGAKIMAEAWYRVLTGDRATQSVIDAMHARPYDVDALRAAYLEWRTAGTQ